MRTRLMATGRLVISALVAMGLITGAAAAGVIDFTPTTGYLVEGSAPYWPVKGYSFRTTVALDLSYAEWFLTLRAGKTIAARLYNYDTQARLASGTLAAGDGGERWYHSDISYHLAANANYTLAFYHTDPDGAPFDRKDYPTQPYSVSGGLFTNVVSRSYSLDKVADGFPADWNTWAPFIRMEVHVPPVPEPTSLVLLGLGCAGVVVRRRGARR